LADRAAQQAERKRSGFFTDRFRRARTLIKDTVDEISRPLRATPEVLLPPPVDPEMVVRQDLRFISPRALTTSDGVVHAMRGFYLGRTPVTNAVYARFLEATGEMPPAHWLGAQPPRMKLDHPVVGVSRASAHRYAQWAGLRLPTGLEWLAAARGPAGDAFPWGSTFDAQRANGPGGRGETTPVDAFAHAATAEGCVDLIGNVWEWTDDDARTPAPDAGFAWVFGGSYCHPCAQGGAIARSSVAVDKEYLYLGFRCALDAGVQA
jgi:formylglycine-generating enzyme required for sulfatase activity